MEKVNQFYAYIFIKTHTYLALMKILYGKVLAKEWIDWVEKPHSQGTREEILLFIKNWLAKHKPKVLGDIGCGQGAFSKVVGAKTKYVGIDPSQILIKRAKKLFLSSNKKFMAGDAYNIPLKNESVDALMSIWVWSHLENLELAAKEMCRVLKPQGRFLIITANPETYEERKTFYKKYTIKDNLLTGIFDLGDGKTLTGTTLYLHSKEQVTKAIKHAGLHINYIRRMGQAASSNKGLYLVIEGSK